MYHFFLSVLDEHSTFIFNTLFIHSSVGRHLDCFTLLLLGFNLFRFFLWVHVFREVSFFFLNPEDNKSVDGLTDFSEELH